MSKHLSTHNRESSSLAGKGTEHVPVFPVSSGRLQTTAIPNRTSEYAKKDMMGATFHTFGQLQPLATTTASGMRGLNKTGDEWGAGSQAIVQKGVPSTTLGRTTKSKDGSERAPKQPWLEYGSLSYDSRRYESQNAQRDRHRFNSTMDSRTSYNENRKVAAKANECFILPGSNQGNFRKISDVVPPSRVGKENSFFALREQLGSIHKRMPCKNEKSTSFAVSEEKVARQKFSFNPLNMLLRDKGVQRKQS